MPEPHRVDDQMQIPDLPQPVPAATKQDDVTDGEPVGAGAEKTFRPYDPNQILLLPPNLSEWLPAGAPARVIQELVDQGLELGPILPRERGRRGAAPRHPQRVLQPLARRVPAGGF